MKHSTFYVWMKYGVSLLFLLLIIIGGLFAVMRFLRVDVLSELSGEGALGVVSLHINEDSKKQWEQLFATIDPSTVTVPLMGVDNSATFFQLYSAAKDEVHMAMYEQGWVLALVAKDKESEATLKRQLGTLWNVEVSGPHLLVSNMENPASKILTSSSPKDTPTLKDRLHYSRHLSSALLSFATTEDFRFHRLVSSVFAEESVKRVELLSRIIYEPLRRGSGYLAFTAEGNLHVVLDVKMQGKTLAALTTKDTLQDTLLSQATVGDAYVVALQTVEDFPSHIATFYEEEVSSSLGAMMLTILDGYTKEHFALPGAYRLFSELSWGQLLLRVTPEGHTSFVAEQEFFENVRRLVVDGAILHHTKKLSEATLPDGTKGQLLEVDPSAVTQSGSGETVTEIQVNGETTARVEDTKAFVVVSSSTSPTGSGATLAEASEQFLQDEVHGLLLLPFPEHLTLGENISGEANLPSGTYDKLMIGLRWFDDLLQMEIIAMP